MVEKRLSREVLELGSVRLTDREAVLLELGDFSQVVVVRAVHGTVTARWSPPTGELLGEEFAECLSLYGAVDGLLRFFPSGTSELEAEFVDPATTALKPFELALQSPPSQEPAPRKRRVVRERRFRLRERGEYDWRGRIGIHRPSISDLVAAIEAAGWDSEAIFRLRARGEALAAANTFDELLAVDVSNIDHMPHQEATALKVLRQMHGRAILADEVGLGKTVEAGLIMKELVLRGLASRVLVLVPASLREQWRDELHEKFGETFEIAMSPQEIRGDRLVMSIQLARSHLNRNKLVEEPWDLVIVDEAHKNTGGSVTRQLIGALDTRYMLFLTATPVQNRLTELYTLVELLRPGTFASEREFRRRFVSPQNEREPVDAQGLRSLVADVMVRTTREQVGLDSVQRYAVDMPITLSATERKVYSLCTDGLRRILTAPGDAMRRRMLAHRLTASPRALAITARRITEAHEDPKVRTFLTELSDLAIGFGITKRQQRLLALLQEWTTDRKERGKVIVFTQHTDTLDDLLRIVDEADIEAVAFHGGMSPGARRDAIAGFRKSAKVFVSTEAGAEGLNLQFANCVINFDLPWNPMRIEQRIGRVHRVGQKRDVHVANFFAKDTIDEHVYRLLHDKLRMFEILFGQITTILGELDVSGNQTFEGQILDAFLATDDSAMRTKLDELGTRVDAAYASAESALSEQGGLNAWLVDRSYRDEIRTPAEELKPIIEERQRIRQAQVESFVRDYVDSIGADVRIDEPGFLAFSAPQALRESFGDRDEMYVAFHREALDVHRHAELCAVGTESFEEILASLRELGDLRAAVPEPPRYPDGPWIDHEGELRFIERSIAPTGEWAGRALWRTQITGVDLGHSVELVEFGSFPKKRTKARYRDLVAHEQISTRFGTPADMVNRSIDEAEPMLERQVMLAQEEINERAEAEQLRILAGAREQIPELEARASRGADKEKARAELARVEQLVQHYEQQRPPNAELRADLLALELVGAPRFELAERWATAMGAEVFVRGVWEPDATALLSYRDESDREITRLAVCREGHAIDASNVEPCPACGLDSCDLCRADGALSPCRACGVRQCRKCQSGFDAVCASCSTARRVPELDTDGMRAWALGFGAVALVGEGVCYLTDAQGAESILFERDAADQTGRARLIAFAEERGLRRDLGLQLGDELDEWELPSDSILLMDHSTVEEAVVDGLGCRIDEGALDQIPGGAQESSFLRESKLSKFIDRLRKGDAPSTAPALVLRVGRHVGYLSPRSDGLWLVERVAVAGTEPVMTAKRVEFAPDLARPSQAVARAAGWTLRASRLNRALVLDVEDPDGDGTSYFVPAQPGMTEAVERALKERSAAAGLPEDSVLGSDGIAPMPLEFAAPDGPELLRRIVTPVWRILHSFPSGQTDTHVLADADIPLATAFADPLPAEPYAGVTAQVSQNLPTPDDFTLVRLAEVRETWRDFAEVSVVRYVHPGQPAFPLLDDTGEPASDFRVDSNRHLHGAGAGWECRSCGRHLCSACGDVARLGTCRECRQEACEECRSRAPVQVEAAECSNCGARNCGRCHRDIGAKPCPLCHLNACSSCWAGPTCRACADLIRADVEEIESLPTELRARGMTVWSSKVGDVRRVFILGHTRSEYAVLEDANVTRWISATAIDGVSMRVVFGIAELNALPADLNLDVQWRDPVASDREPSLVLERSEQCEVSWFITRASGAIAARSKTSLALGSPEIDPIAAVAAATSSREIRVPERADEEALAAFPEMPLPQREDPPVNLCLEVLPTVQAVEVTGAGLIESTRNPESELSTLTPWSGDAGLWAEVVHSEPVPDATLVATSGDRAVLAARFGPYLVLRSRIGDVEVWMASDGLDFPAAVVLADRLELERGPLIVSGWLDPRKAALVSVLDAEPLGPLLSPKALPKGGTDDALARSAATNCWVGAESSRWPQSRKSDWLVPANVSASLKDLLGVKPAHAKSIVIGAHVRQTFVVGGEQRTLAYDLAPGGGCSFVADDTGHYSPTIRFDRSGHAAAAAMSCPYCGTWSCSTCDESVAPCAICGIARCQMCAKREHGLSLCEACATCAPLSRLRRIVKRGGDGFLLIGTDSVHSIEIAIIGDTARVSSDRGSAAGSTRMPLAVSDIVRSFLNDKAGRELFRNAAG